MTAQYDQLYELLEPKKGNHDRLERQFNALKDQHTELESQHTALEDKYAVLESKHTALREKHTALESQYTALTGKYTKIENENRSIALDSKIKLGDQRLVSEQKLNEHTAASQLEKEIFAEEKKALQLRVTTLEEALAQILEQHCTDDSGRLVVNDNDDAMASADGESMITDATGEGDTLVDNGAESGSNTSGKDVAIGNNASKEGIFVGDDTFVSSEQTGTRICTTY